MSKDIEKNNDFRFGFVALLGQPNVGKSTLLNKFLGTKLSIVTPKAQTTRTRIHGILNQHNSQIVFVDTPGFCSKNTPLHRAMRHIAGNAASDSNLNLLIFQIKGKVPKISAEDYKLIQAATNGLDNNFKATNTIAVINKIDRIPSKKDLLPWIDFLAKELPIDKIIPISAKKGDGLDVLLEILIERLPASPPLFPTDMLTDKPERFLCEELIREQVMMQTHNEVPHSAAVVIEVFDDERSDDEHNPRGCHLEGRIYLEKDSQKAIVIGNQAKRIKEISSRARLNIEQLLGCKVFLRLTVHVDKRWTRSVRGIRRFGLDSSG